MPRACSVVPKQRFCVPTVLVSLVAGLSLWMHLSSVQHAEVASSVAHSSLSKAAQLVHRSRLRQTDFASKSKTSAPTTVSRSATQLPSSRVNEPQKMPLASATSLGRSLPEPQHAASVAPTRAELHNIHKQAGFDPLLKQPANPAAKTLESRPPSPAKRSALHHGAPSATCASHFDFDMLQAWDALKKPFCKPLPSAHTPQSALQCRVTVDGHLPAPTAPHTICDGKNIVLDWSKTSPTNCVAHRPGYMCGGAAIWWAFAPGAFRGSCSPTDAFQSGAFPRDHLRAMFGSWESKAAVSSTHAGTHSSTSSPVTLLVTRERGEHANWFHSTTDILNAFIALHVAGVIDATRDGGTYADSVLTYTPPAQGGAERQRLWWQSPLTQGAFAAKSLEGDSSGDHTANMRSVVARDVSVLVMDAQHEGPFDPLWGLLYAPRHGVRRSEALREAGGELLMPHAVFSPPGYTSFLLSHLTQDADCVQATHLMRSFSRFVLGSLGLSHLMPAVQHSALPPMLVTIISRRPYVKGAVDHKRVGRQVDNEPELVAAIEAAGRSASVDVHAQLVDFAHLNITQQIELVAHSDVLVGMHGAGLTHVPYLPPWGGALELWPKASDMWRCFEHLARWSGVEYRRWANRHPSAFREDSHGDHTRVHAAEVQATAQQLLQAVLLRREQWASSALRALAAS